MRMRRWSNCSTAAHAAIIARIAKERLTAYSCSRCFPGFNQREAVGQWASVKSDCFRCSVSCSARSRAPNAASNMLGLLAVSAFTPSR